jgi:exopolysaccharide biosynthesis predicted pyruvyltransferase EpsI
MSSLDRKFNRLFSLEATITRCSEILMAHQNSNRKVLIFYQSGGNWGDLYFKDEHGPRMRCFQTLYNQTRNSHLNVQVISMQQSIFFEDTTNAIPDDDFFQSIQIPDFFQLAVRQFDSYDMALELYPSLHPNNIHLLPDNAFMVDPVHFNQYTPTVDVLILMRVDGEAVLHTSEKLKLQQKLQDAGITFRFTDWNLLDKDEINAFDATNGDPEVTFMTFFQYQI